MTSNLRVSPTITVTPASIVSVCPLRTVQLSITTYGLPDLFHVPEMFPDTSVPWTWPRQPSRNKRQMPVRHFDGVPDAGLHGCLSTTVVDESVCCDFFFIGICCL